MLLPLLDELASVTPVRVTLATSALLLLCVVIATTALTRLATSGAPGGERPAAMPAMSRGAA